MKYARYDTSRRSRAAVGAIPLRFTLLLPIAGYSSSATESLGATATAAAENKAM